MNYRKQHERKVSKQSEMPFVLYEKGHWTKKHVLIYTSIWNNIQKELHPSLLNKDMTVDDYRVELKKLFEIKFKKVYQKNGIDRSTITPGFEKQTQIKLTPRCLCGWCKKVFHIEDSNIYMSGIYCFDCLHKYIIPKIEGTKQ